VQVYVGTKSKAAAGEVGEKNGLKEGSKSLINQLSKKLKPTISTLSSVTTIQL